IAITGIMLMLFSVPAGALEDRVVAVVNSDIITLSELNESFIPMLKRINADSRSKGNKKILHEAKRALLERLIQELLIGQEASRLNISVKETEVESLIEERLSERNMDKKGLLKALEKENIAYETYTDNVKKEIMRMKLLRREIRSKIAVSDEDIGEYYRAHRDLYEGKEAVRIQQILTMLPRECSREMKEQLRQRAGKVLEHLKSGDRFDLVAREYSQGPAAKEGGDLGFIEKGMILPELEKVAFSLSVGEVSGIIESPVGFHIIKVADKRGAGTKPLEEVREEIIAEIGNKRMEGEFMEWLDELAEKSYIEIRL
ncbi:MAG: peptidylprolyl isomerase, partial [Syntrophales bacterium]|nr:peptidylprolyl isomerase [Syntrophales bacterium]